MKYDEISRDNLQEFLDYYHYLHDSTISNINYDIYNSKIEMLIDVFWSGTPKLKEGKTYETNKTKLKIIFEGIEKCNNKEIYSWDFINNVFIKYIKLNNKEFICFAEEEEDPYIYIVCDKIIYEEHK